MVLGIPHIYKILFHLLNKKFSIFEIFADKENSQLQNFFNWMSLPSGVEDFFQLKKGKRTVPESKIIQIEIKFKFVFSRSILTNGPGEFR